jgi:predicted hotdog family 3-hydroxylacyl-ACP dehydratase
VVYPVVYPALQTILPHRPPMILIDEMVACSEREVTCVVTVREGAPFVADGRVPALISIEYFAQTVAAFFGYRGRDDPAGFTMGMLLGTRELDLRADYFHVGEVLTITGKEQWGAGQLASFVCEVLRGDEVLARAAISVLQGSASDLPTPPNSDRAADGT